MKRDFEIVVGMKLRFLVIRFNAGWEFDCPVIVLDPVYRFYEDGRSIESAIEDVLIDACVNGRLGDDSSRRNWSIPYLRRKAAAVLGGKKYPIAWAQAGREAAEFAVNADGNLTVRGWGDEVQESRLAP